MSRRGVWQLKKLVIKYSGDGSSRGTSAYVESMLPAFREANPQLQVEVNRTRQGHPYLQGYYVNGVEKAVPLRNLAPDEVSSFVATLRNGVGRSSQRAIPRVTRGSIVSVQGAWTPAVQAAILAARPPSTELDKEAKQRAEWAQAEVERRAKAEALALKGLGFARKGDKGAVASGKASAT
eukprot:jgi/Mesvir1/21900/Mv01965-RA.1